MFYKTVFIVPWVSINRGSPLHRDRSTEYPIYPVENISVMGSPGRCLGQPSGPSDKRRYGRPVLVTHKDESNRSVQVFICSCTVQRHYHRWMPILNTPRRTKQPFPGVEIIPLDSKAMARPGHLCFSHSFQVTPVGAGRAAVSTIKHGIAQLDPSLKIRIQLSDAITWSMS